MENCDSKDARPTYSSRPSSSVFPMSKSENEHLPENLRLEQLSENYQPVNHVRAKKCREAASSKATNEKFRDNDEQDWNLRTKTTQDYCGSRLNGSFDIHESLPSVFDNNSEEYLSKKFNEIVNLCPDYEMPPTLSTNKKSAHSLNGCTYRSSCGQLPNVCLCSFSIDKSVENETDLKHSPKCASNCCNKNFHKCTDSPKTNGYNCIDEAVHSEKADFWCEPFNPVKAQPSYHKSACSLPSECTSEHIEVKHLESYQALDSIVYVGYESEKQMPDIMRLIQKDLSEPYSVYTYRYFIHNWPHLCFLAFHEDKCVGAVVCKLDIHKKSIRRGYIAMLAVDENYRKKRIGSNLVLKAIRAMIIDDADEVVLETEITNKPALQLYENLGFVRDKRLFRYYLNGVDALRLKLWLK